MAMWKDDEVGFDLPSHSHEFTKQQVIAALADVPDDAKMHFVGMFDSFDVVFRWRRLMTPEEEQRVRDARAERQRQIDEAEADDRKAGF